MKQVIVVDESLQLPKGKLAAQVAHGSLAAYLNTQREVREAWVESGMTKVVLRAKDSDELQELRRAAKTAGLPAELIRDAGRTLLPEGTITCLGIGPAPSVEIDRITGSLRLLD